ncbi:MBL fold metallo-hydrolase, partial [Mesorhizobium sp. M4B.F.Ca.ET.013.02.1.1]
FEKKTGILLSGDIIYDGPLIDDVYHSLVDDYVATLLSVRGLDVSVVHGGHFPSFGKVRYRQLIDEYLAQKRQAGCHLRQPA